MPTISLATVYNCLETLAETKLIRQVNFEREPTRYCPNLTKHAHFYCRESGEIVDVDLSDQLLDELMKVYPQASPPNTSKSPTTAPATNATTNKKPISGH